MAKADIEDLKKRLEKIHPKLFEALKEKKNFFSFRANLHKTTPNEVIARLEKEGFTPKKVQNFENAFILPIKERKKIIKSPVYTNELIYIQNLSSIFAAEALDIQKEDWVLDLAAAPGGKSLIFSEKAQKVSAVEPNKERFFRMKRNFKQKGAKNIQTYNKDGRFVYKSCPMWFDKVFLDAPCSSEAHIELEKGITWWSLRRIHKFAKLQKELIISAFESLKSGGEMIYATCTFAPEENEAVVNFLLQRYPNAVLLEIEHNLSNTFSGLTHWQGEEFSKELTKTLHIIPKDAFSGFYLAKIKKLF